MELRVSYRQCILLLKQVHRIRCFYSGRWNISFVCDDGGYAVVERLRHFFYLRSTDFYVILGTGSFKSNCSIVRAIGVSKGCFHLFSVPAHREQRKDRSSPFFLFLKESKEILMVQDIN